MGHERQNAGIGIAVADTRLVALHHQSAADGAAHHHGHAQPARETQVTAGLGDLAIPLQFLQAARIDDLRLPGPEHEFRQAAAAGQVAELQGVAIAFVHVVRKIVALFHRVVQADVAIFGVQQFAQQAMHRLQEVVERQVGRRAFGNAVEHPLQRLGLFLLACLGLQLACALFQPQAGSRFLALFFGIAAIAARRSRSD